jgi:ATP/maltotriose-dependent transcriptional regulator MalT/DNA-binding SARP family transcriptional activator
MSCRRTVDPTGYASVSFDTPPSVDAQPVAGNGRSWREASTSVVVPPETEGRVDHRPISRTKITPALCREPTLERPRLLNWLEENIARRVVLIVAEAGYGKTTLLADFSRKTSTHCLWYKLDSTDRDWPTFVTYLVAAGREIQPNFGHQTWTLLGRSHLLESRDGPVESLAPDFEFFGDQRVAIVLDDYHLVDESEDVRYILTRLIKNTPENVTFVLSTRGRPTLPLARLSAQGDVAELDTAALRFSREETHKLFYEMHRRDLDAAILDEIDRRTQGWPACLGLVVSSLRGRSNNEIDRFVRNLSGTESPIYDFLAQEVLSGLSPSAQRLTVLASLLDPVVPYQIKAMVAGESAIPNDKDIAIWTADAETLGLLTTYGEPPSTRFHPLMRDFLRQQLVEELTEAELRELHLRVAHAAESKDWLTACHHYLAAGEPTEAAKILGGSAVEALGSGQWHSAAEILRRIRSLDGDATDSSVAVLTAFQDIDQSRLDQVIDALRVVDLRAAPPVTRALIRHALYRAYWRRGDEAELSAINRATLDDAEAPQIFRDIARLHTLVYEDEGTASYKQVASELVDAASRQYAAGMYFFASVSLHNAMVVEHSRANYSGAVALGHRAIQAYGRTGIGAREVQTTHAMMARCYAELGSPNEYEHVARATTEPVFDPDVFSECAFLAAAEGDDETAIRLRGALARVLQEHQVHGLARSFAVIADAAGHLFGGQPRHAIEALNQSDATHRGIGIDLTAATILALAWLAAGDAERAAALARKGMDRARREGVPHWETRLEIVDAAARNDAKRLVSAVKAASGMGRMALLETADALAMAMHLLDPLPNELADSISAYPARWLPALRRQLERGLSPAGYTCALLLQQFGTTADIPRLRAFEKTYLRATKVPGLARRLARRVAPDLSITDLGPSSLIIGDRVVEFSGIRRRSASLLAFLITRRSNSAAREQVLDALWPDLDPAAASNSLNQTMYFLRRDIDPWYDDDVSVEYVHAEGDMLWIDPEKVSIASVAYEAEASKALGADRVDLPLAQIAIDRYTGRFCPEFEYEEWSSAWRDRLHASYLHLVTEVETALVAEGRLTEAAAITQKALAIEPEAVDLEGRLVSLYMSLGSRAAAAEQYAHYSRTHREQLGVDPPTFIEMMAKAAAGAGSREVRHSTY